MVSLNIGSPATLTTQQQAIMKASSRPQSLLRVTSVSMKPRLSRHLVVLVLIVSSHLTVSGSSPPIRHEGFVGGNVTFYCPVDTSKKLEFLYFQQNGKFITGHHTRPLPTSWPNTIMDLNNTAIHMHGLNLSHTGEYECYIRYLDEGTEPVKITLHLSVTAPFSKPSITNTCKEENLVGCYVTCASHNGYPFQRISWSVGGNVSSQMWERVNDSKVESSTKTVNVSSTAYFNCSGGVMSVSCSVGNLTSQVLQVCVPQAPPPNMKVCVAVVFSVLVVAGIVVLIYKKRKAAEARSVSANGHPTEVIALRESNGGTEEP